MSVDVDIFQQRDRVKKPVWRKALPWVIGVIAGRSADREARAGGTSRRA
jgi:hypothetical protein